MAIAATASDSPLIQGRNARVNGQAKETCPYQEGSEECSVWLQAWDEAGSGPDSETPGSETWKDPLSNA